MPPLNEAASRTARVRVSRGELWRGLDHSLVMGTELLAAILVWGGIGWLVDRWLGTGPWLFAVGALVGNFAGLYLIWLRSERMNQVEEARRAREAAR